MKILHSFQEFNKLIELEEKLLINEIEFSDNHKKDKSETNCKNYQPLNKEILKTKLKKILPILSVLQIYDALENCHSLIGQSIMCVDFLKCAWPIVLTTLIV
jgi:hypothetical protein